ncbi:hypothetical protein QE439_001680 [Pedobacter agri]|nr:hypothetical protein [Pedobacter agri]
MTLKKHKVAINFFSKPLVWHERIDNHLLVSQFTGAETDETFTNLFQIQPFVSIHSIKTIS